MRVGGSHRRYDKFQFTHPGGVRQSYERWALDKFNVSIHAPGRGATSARHP